MLLAILTHGQEVLTPTVSAPVAATAGQTVPTVAPAPV
jgi:hypothetical protein